eukprot:1111611-Prorocentrum_minimum.AAC.1
MKYTSAWSSASNVASSWGTPSDVALNVPSSSYSNLSPAHSDAMLFTPASAPSPSRASSYKVAPSS